MGGGGEVFLAADAHPSAPQACSTGIRRLGCLRGFPLSACGAPLCTGGEADLAPVTQPKGLTTRNPQRN